MRQFIGDDIYDNPYLKENDPMSGGYGEYLEVSDNTEPIYAQATDNDVVQPLPENEYDMAKGGDDEHIYCLVRDEDDVENCGKWKVFAKDQIYQLYASLDERGKRERRLRTQLERKQILSKTSYVVKGTHLSLFVLE